MQERQNCEASDCNRRCINSGSKMASRLCQLHYYNLMENRRERRAKARPKQETVTLHQPSREPPKTKTLVEIASERQLLNTPSQNQAPSVTTTKINPDGTLSTIDLDVDTSASEESPYLDVALYTTTLTILHFTLTVLVHHQYATTPPSLRSIFYSSTVASPTPALLLILVALLHPRSGQPVTQLLFAALSIAAGGWLVYASNEDPYMAVMKKAPPLGTLWVWAIVEMKWEWALGCLGVVAGWGWYKGYSIL